MSVDEAARREGMNKITELAKQANDLLTQAETIANQTGNSFSFSLGNRSMTYNPKTDDPEFMSSTQTCYGEDDRGWKSSSDYC